MTRIKLPKPEPCQLIVFPMSAQIGKVRHVTTVYMQQPSAAAQQRYWETTCKNLRKQLARLSCTEEAIALHLTAFRASVQHEIDRRIKRTSGRNEGPHDPKGAA
ncbi:MAG: DUF6074 family protein [Agrobacterium cavarae]